jgi:hypothetical protein
LPGSVHGVHRNGGTRRDGHGRAIGFWTRALSYELREGGVGADWGSLIPAAAWAPASACSAPAPRRNATRAYTWTCTRADAAEQAAEVQRLVSIGAERVDWDLYPEDLDFIVLADPGQQVLRRQHQPRARISPDVPDNRRESREGSDMLTSSSP